MSFSTDEQHRATLELLREVRDYLERLPKVPVTTLLCAKVSNYLNAPLQTLVAKSLEPRRGEVVSPAGLVQLEAELRGDELTIHLPKLEHPHTLKQTTVSLTLKRDSAQGAYQR